jgi:hypothetical protein
MRSIDREPGAAVHDDRAAINGRFARSSIGSDAIDPDRFDEKIFPNRGYDLLTRDSRHAIDSADMIARIFDCDHPNRCPTHFDLLFDSKGQRSPFFFLSSQTQNVVRSAATSCNSPR